MKTAFAALALTMFAIPSNANAQVYITSPSVPIVTSSYYYPSSAIYYNSVPYVQQPIVQQNYAPTVAYSSPGYVATPSYYYGYPAYSSYSPTYVYPYATYYSAYSSPGYYNSGYRGLFGRRW